MDFCFVWDVVSSIACGARTTFFVYCMAGSVTIWNDTLCYPLCGCGPAHKTLSISYEQGSLRNTDLQKKMTAVQLKFEVGWYNSSKLMDDNDEWRDETRACSGRLDRKNFCKVLNDHCGRDPAEP